MKYEVCFESDLNLFRGILGILEVKKTRVRSPLPREVGDGDPFLREITENIKL